MNELQKIVEEMRATAVRAQYTPWVDIHRWADRLASIAEQEPVGFADLDSLRKFGQARIDAVQNFGYWSPLYTEPRPPAEGWRPIESVPLGKRVLLNWPDYPHVECGTAYDDSDDGSVYFVLFDGDSMDTRPKEWMPLPL